MSDYNGIKMNINGNRKYKKKYTNHWKLKKTLVNDNQFNEETRSKFEKSYNGMKIKTQHNEIYRTQ